MDFMKKAVGAIVLLAGFIFTVSFSTLYAQTHIVEGTACQCTLPIPLLIPTFSSLGVMVGSIVYYLMSSKVQESKERATQDVKKVLKILDPEEREVVEAIIENKGKAIQSSISRKIGKVRAFRAIEKLKRKGVVKKEPYGKTNIITFTEEFEKTLLP